ncbi:uncharacterized protein isoform X1 [Leptinotarsa decemlineata]|uniref:uncharacterized protein isoform X1 n=1 Tax=Leptinotarsa decemlineata TaxID=7539 RepID=UPI000C2545CB|nr:uncharacterized protein LOC111505423 isoform X1 [Leptinotarsa decemlineata]
MRESLSYGMFPLLPENMDTAMLNSGSNTLISFNGYYGYQPQINPPDKGSTRNENQEQARNDRMDMDVQSEESDMQMQMVNVRRHINRKRRSEHVADIREFKKRRDCSDANDSPPTLPPKINPVPTPLITPTRKPTHNIPDLSRCTMGHYF